MYREPPPVCSVCGNVVEAHDADVTDAGLRCRRCTDAAELAAMQPALDEARAAQRAWAEIHAKHPVRPVAHCSDHSEWSSHCLRCVLASWLPDED